MKGFFYCEHCKLFIETLTTVRTRNLRKEKIVIPYCCHCEGKLKEVEPNKYKHKDYNLYTTIFKTYKLRGRNKQVKIRLKFLI